jgi:hypothetical protein
MFLVNGSPCPVLQLFPLMIIFKYVAAKLLFQRWICVVIAKHWVKTVCRIFHGSVVTKLHAM